MHLPTQGRLTAGFLPTLACLCALLLANAPPAAAQTGEISGTVTDAETGEPLPGVNVVIEGTQRGASTDSDGDYVIEDVAPGTYTVRASFVSYQTKSTADVSVETGETTTLNFQLRQAQTKMDEVVITGLGEQSRATLTSSVSKLDSTALDNVPYTSASSALQGTIPGLRVQTTTGQPGASPRIILRGGTSIDNPNGATPLYVVDGVIRPNLSDLSALDIESIQVLKDAAATSIYGARGSNGVVVVETKSGDPGETRVQYTARLTSNQLQQRRDLGSAREYIKYGRLGVAATAERHPGRLGRLNLPVGFGTGNDLTKNTGFTTQYLTDENRHKLDEGWEQMPDPLNPDKTIIFKETDWQDVLFRRALTQNHHLSVSGGSEDATFNVNVGRISAEGVAIQTGYNRTTLDMGGNLDITEDLRLGGQLNFSNSNDETVFSENWIFQRSLGLPPTAKLRYEDGTLAPGQNISIGNPKYFLNVLERDHSTNRFTVALDGQWDVTSTLTFEPSGSIYAVRDQNSAFDPEYRFAPNLIIDSRNASESRTLRLQRQMEGVFTYDNVFSETHNLELKAGASYYDRDISALSASGRGAATDHIPTLNASAEPVNVSSEETKRRIIGGFGRLQYDYAGRYLLSTSVRYDGASNLGENNRWGVFPGISGGWNVDEEAFWSAVPSSIISRLKLRASYGVAGNISGLSDFHAQGQYSVGNEYAGRSAILNTRLANPDLKWERSSTFDVGIDLGVYNDRITLLADYYRRLTEDQLTSLRLPQSTGFTSILTNLGALRNTGVEFEVGATVLQDVRGFEWDVSFNAAWNRNTVVELPENQNENNRIGGKRVYDPEQGEYVWVGGIQEGKPLGNMYAYHHMGVYSTEEAAENGPRDILIAGTNKTKKAGDAIFEDLDNNGVIDSRDQVYVGNEFPDWTGGMSTTLRYGNVTLRARADFATGHTIFNRTLATLNGQTQGDINVSKEVVNRSWKESGDETNVPRYYWADQLAQNNIMRGWTGTSYYYEDGDYLALREVTLSYDLPETWVQSVGLNNSRIYATGSNLGYLTGYKGLLPESGGTADGRYPNPRSFTLGVNVTLQ
jgi:TonB-linked SusC/RagA family outer membrane protein